MRNKAHILVIKIVGCEIGPMKGVAKDVLLSKVITFNHKKANSAYRTQVGLRSHIVIIVSELDRNRAQINCNFRAFIRWEVALNGNKSCI